MAKLEKVTKLNGALASSYYVEKVDDTPKRDPKIKVRHEIQEQVFDLHDSVADNAKMISLLASLVARIYDMLPQSKKDALPAEEKATIEYALSQFSNSTTWGDVQLKNEGTKAIDKLIDRQNKIANIVKQIYGIK